MKSVGLIFISSQLILNGQKSTAAKVDLGEIFRLAEVVVRVGIRINQVLLRMVTSTESEESYSDYCNLNVIVLEIMS